MMLDGAMFKKVLIANRGAIACRIIRTLRRLGVESIAVFSDADRHSLHVTAADQAIWIGPSPAAQSYLDIDRVLAAAQAAGAEAIHPGYGFLSENSEFVERCEAAGLVFVGPTADQIRAFGLKHTARALAANNRVPLLPGSDLLDSPDAALAAAERIGYPVMLKSTAGGGGIGMQLCSDPTALQAAFDPVQRLSRNNFANSGVFLERAVLRARHVEVQILGDGRGGVVALGERDCSLQRRHQKLVEETPAPHLPASVRAAMCETAVRLGRSVDYRSAGTVEYLYDTDRQAFHFLEVNTRLQVEHGVTEAVTGLDLVEWMLRIAAGESLDTAALGVSPRGHAIQTRVYAEDPGRDFQPSTGELTELRIGAGARVETWVERGSEVSPFYDAMIAKLIVHGSDRDDAIARMAQTLADTSVAGIETNLGYLRQIVADPQFRAGHVSTAQLRTLSYRASTIDVVAGGMQTTVQDWPGRVGYWDIGVPPSGPMDALSFRLGNRLLGNPPDAAGLEITVSGPTLRFNVDAQLALTGAAIGASVDGVPIPHWQAVTVRRGQTLTFGRIDGAGARSYLLIRGGLDVPRYLGSRATFTLGRFGGHGGRQLRAGDVLHLAGATVSAPVALPPSLCPVLSREWTLRVVNGPHGAPDFFTVQDIETLFATRWEVHYNSSRTGVRLIGPAPQWARNDGGEAGLHPSNIHDNAYAIGTIDFTGDMPVILGPDGPSLGGFVCPATVISADLWKLGQLAAGDGVRFEAVSLHEARQHAAAQEAVITGLTAPQTSRTPPADLPAATTRTPMLGTSPVLASRGVDAHPVGVMYRAAGDRYLLVEYGPIVLDLRLRFRVQALLEWLRQQAITGILELTPGVRSLQIHYDPAQLAVQPLLALLERAEDVLEDLSDVAVPSRIVHLPLAWDDSQTRLAVEKYARSVRADAPWCPSNLEFIRRINGLDSEDAVRHIVHAASYLVMGLGDVYLSAPLATPLDPRHRLVTTKYNPARTWTPENAVGIGGSYMCIYGMEGPGGYQFVGRTLQVWNRHHRTPEFQQPWLLRFFDQIRFYPVSEDELLAMREDFPRGRCRLTIEETTFSLQRYNRFLAEHDDDIQRFKHRQRAAFDAERRRWAEAGHMESAPLPQESDRPPSVALAADESLVESPVHGVVWQLAVAEGDRVELGQSLLVLEFMKTEVSIVAEQAGQVCRILCAQGAQIMPGQPLLTIVETG